MDDKKYNNTQDQKSNYRKDQDWLLEDLVVIAEDGQHEIGITLHVNGLIITGTLIRGKKYFEAITEQVGRFDDAVAGILMEKANEIYNPIDSDDIYSNLVMIHLANARVISAGGIFILSGSKKEGFYWRGKLSSIDGFHLGELEGE